MCSVKCSKLICRHFACTVELTHLDRSITVVRCFCITKTALLVRDFRLEILIIHFLDLLIERFIVTPIVFSGEHHGKDSTRLKKFERLTICDLLRDPLDRRRRVDHIELLLPEIMGNEVIVYDREIRAVRVFLFHLRIKVFTKLDGMVITTGIEDGIGSLSRAGTQL